MYLGRYEVADGGGLVQGVVRVEGEPTGDAAGELWRQQVDHLAAAMAAGLSPAGTALRLAISPERPCERVIAVACPVAQEAPLERWLAAFTRLERVGGVRVETVREAEPARLEEILAGSLPRRRGRVADGLPLATAGAWLVAPWRVRERLDDLARRSLLASRFLTYVAHIAPAEPDRETLRAARRNLLLLERAPGLPAALFADQRSRVDLFARSRMVLDEYLAVEGAAVAWQWLADAVRDWPPPTPGVRWPVAPELREVSAGEDEALATGLPIELLFGAEGGSSPAERIARCAEPEAFVELLSWISPEPRPAEQAALGEGLSLSASEALRCAAEPWAGDGPYAFVSYSRRDAARVAEILDRLAARGVRLWYDAGIPGGAEWDAHIEERLDRCSAVLLFLSPAAAASRYVRREVKYADARCKPLLPVLLEQTRLGEGLGMLLSAVQMLDAGQPNLVERLGQAFLRTAAAPSPLAAER